MHEKPSFELTCPVDPFNVAQSMPDDFQNRPWAEVEIIP
jgi:hypothetical protein